MIHVKARGTTFHALLFLLLLTAFQQNNSFFSLHIHWHHLRYTKPTKHIPSSLLGCSIVKDDLQLHPPPCTSNTADTHNLPSLKDFRHQNHPSSS
uniref:Putative ovule protein n=1 Tax=Solanum chacoense TaxID=4108 RepID=A0A0V0GKP1_SOLCH